MSGLSEADRTRLDDLWTREDMDWLPAVEAIVTRAVNEALTEAAMEVDRTADICIDAHGPDCIGGISYRDAARIVRARTT